MGWDHANIGAGGAFTGVSGLGSTIFTAGDLSGVYKSQDSGTSWSNEGSANGMSDQSCVGVAVHPTNPNIVLRGGEGGNTTNGKGLERSTDGGATWAAITSITGFISAVAFSPRDPNYVFAIKHGQFNSNDPILFRSADAGSTWASVYPFPGVTRGLKLVPSPLKTDVLIVISGNDSGVSGEPSIYFCSNATAATPSFSRKAPTPTKYAVVSATVNSSVDPTLKTLTTSGNFLTAGVAVGNGVAGPGVPPGTKVVTVSATSLTVDKALTVQASEPTDRVFTYCGLLDVAIDPARASTYMATTEAGLSDSGIWLTTNDFGSWSKVSSDTSKVGSIAALNTALAQLATLRPSDNDSLGDSSDATYTGYTTPLLTNVFSQDTGVIGGATMGGTPHPPDSTISGIVMHVRVKATNPVSEPNNLPCQLTGTLAWSTSPTNQDSYSLGSSIDVHQWTTLSTGTITLDPDHNAWTWAKVNLLQAVVLKARFFNDTLPFGPYVGQVQLSDIWVDVLGPGSVVLATLRPSYNRDLSDRLDSTFVMYTSPLLTGTFSVDADPLGGVALADAPQITHIVVNVRVKARNPVSEPNGLSAGITNGQILWSTTPVNVGTYDVGRAFDVSQWTTVSTAPVTTDPYGAPWTWASVNALQKVGIRATFYNDTVPFGPYVGELDLSEVWIDVYGVATNGLLAVLRPSNVPALADANDGTYASYDTSTLTNIFSEDVGSGLVRISGDPLFPSIDHLVISVRAKATNPLTGSSPAAITNGKIVWSTSPTNQANYSLGTAFDVSDWTTFATNAITVDPDGHPWTWAKVNALRGVGITATFFNDEVPFGPYTGELAVSEIWVQVFGPSSTDLIITLRPADALALGDGLDSTYTAYTTPTLSNSFSQNTGNIGGVDIADVPLAISQSPLIDHIIVRVRVKALNPVSEPNGLPAAITNSTIFWSTSGSNQSSANVDNAFNVSDWTTVSTPEIPLDPDGYPWTWDAINLLQNVGIKATFSNDEIPFGPYVGRLYWADVWVEVYGPTYWVVADTVSSTRGTYVSTNRGASWTTYSRLGWSGGWKQNPEATGMYGNCTHGVCNTLQTQSGNSDLWWLTANFLFRSTDRGRIFRSAFVNEVTPGTFRGTGIFDQVITSVSKSGNYVYVGTYDTGMLLSADGGTSWKSINSPLFGWHDSSGNNMHGGNCLGILVDPARPNRAWACCSLGYVPGDPNPNKYGGNKEDPYVLIQTSDYGATWSRCTDVLQSAAGGVAMGITLDPDSSSTNRTLYVTSDGNCYKSSDDGAHWALFPNSGSGQGANRVVAAKGSTVFVGGNGGLWRTTDNGGTWVQMGPGVFPTGTAATPHFRWKGVHSILIVSTTVVYVTYYDDVSSLPTTPVHGLYKTSTNGGNGLDAEWTRILADN